MITRYLNAVRDYLTSPTVRDAGADIRDELEFHLAEQVDELVAAGMSESGARQMALERFGNPEQIAVECYAAGHGSSILWRRLHLAVTAALVAIVAGLGWLTFNGQTATARTLPPPIASMIDNNWAGDVTGRVLDNHDRPIANADVLVVVKTWPDQSYFQRAYNATTDQQGAFRIDDVYPLNEEYEVQVTAMADHRVLESRYFAQQAGELSPVGFQLAPSGFFAVRAVSESGIALAGVEVFPHQRIARNGPEHSVYFDSAEPVIRQTDAAGLVELPWYKPGEEAVLYLRAPNQEWGTHTVTVPELGHVVAIPVSIDTRQHSQET